jgi:Domain of unknown function (DUF397)
MLHGEGTVMSVPRRDLSWHRSSTCADRTCAEVATDGEYVYVRDGKVPDAVVLRFTPAEWKAFKQGMMLGDFDFAL